MKSTEGKTPRVFLDTNILIDYVLFRGEEAPAAEYIFESAMNSVISIYIAAHSLTNLYYSVRKDLTPAERDLTLLNLCAICNVMPITAENIEKAITANYTRDVEDSLQIQCALDADCEYFVTRDNELFKKSPVETLLPHELTKELSL